MSCVVQSMCFWCNELELVFVFKTRDVTNFTTTEYKLKGHKNHPVLYAILNKDFEYKKITYTISIFNSIVNYGVFSSCTLILPTP